MPLRLQIGLQQKVGLPDYGSRGASCQVELELDGQSLDRDPAGFQQQVARLFDACQESIRRELARPVQVPAPPPDVNSPAVIHDRKVSSSATRRATQSQIRALQAIAGRQGWNLASDLQQRYGVTRPEDLELKQASRLIDEWNRPTPGSRA